MSPSRVRLAYGLIWIISGTLKSLGIVAEILTGKEMISISLPYFAKSCVLPFYAEIIAAYFVPSALFFISLTALAGIIGGFLILQPGNWAKLGLSIGIAMNIVYGPLAGLSTIVLNALMIIPQVWLWSQDLSENLLKKILGR